MATPKNAAGPLIEKVAFDQLAEVSDGAGNYTDGFVEQFQTQAGYIYLRGNEQVLAARLEGVQPAMVRVRACIDTARITTDWRMRDIRRNAAYAVRAITESPNRGYFDLLVQKGVAA